MNFRDWINGQDKQFRYSPTIADPTSADYEPTKQTRELIANIAYIRRDPRFANWDDHQIEMMLMHHTPEEILKHGPERALERWYNFSILDGMGASADWDGFDLCSPLEPDDPE